MTAKLDRIWLLFLTLCTALLFVVSAHFAEATHAINPSVSVSVFRAQHSAQSKIGLPLEIIKTSQSNSQQVSDAALPLYQDPAQRFQIGILEGYQVTPVGDSFVIESPDGNLAYTVVVRSRASDFPLTDTDLAQVSIDTFSQGEGFIAGEFELDSQDGVIIPWTGTLSQGFSKQPMSGLILTRQFDNTILSLLVSSTEATADNVEVILNTLADTLQANS